MKVQIVNFKDIQGADSLNARFWCGGGYESWINKARDMSRDDCLAYFINLICKSFEVYNTFAKKYDSSDGRPDTLSRAITGSSLPEFKDVPTEMEVVNLFSSKDLSNLRKWVVFCDVYGKEIAEAKQKDTEQALEKLLTLKKALDGFLS